MKKGQHQSSIRKTHEVLTTTSVQAEKEKEKKNLL
jgi:hypothetical protein